MQRRRWRLCLAAAVSSILFLTLLCLLTPTMGGTEGSGPTQHSGRHLAVVPGSLPADGFRLTGVHEPYLFSGSSATTRVFPAAGLGHALPVDPNAVAVSQAAPGATRAVSATQRQGDGVVDYWAVLVGIADFVGTLNDLNYTDDDAIDMQAALLSYPNWDPQHIQLLLDTQGTKANIQAAIQTMGSNADDDDVCLFFYSSHGTTYPDTAPLDEADGLDEAICTYNIGTQDILDDELGTWLAQLPTSNYVVIIDTCFSGGQIKGGGQVRGIGTARPAPGDGFAADLVRILGIRPKDLDDNAVGVVMTACDDSELSQELPTLQNGVFTYYVLQGMAGPADANGNSEISAEEAYYYADPLATSDNPFQHAQLYDGYPGELELSSAVDRPPSAPRNVAAGDTPNDEGGSITVTWRRSADDGGGSNDVVKYEVHRAVGSATGTFANISGDLAPGTQSYEDTPTVDGTDYYYFVRVYDPSYQTDSSVVGPARSRDDLPPPQITNLVAADRDSDQGGAVQLRWNPYAAPSDFAQYRLYRKESQFAKTTGLTPFTTISTSGTMSYLDQSPQLKNGTKYFYAVTAVDDSVPPNENPSVITASATPAIDFEYTFPAGVSLAAVPANPFDPSPVAVFGVPPAATGAAARAVTAEIARWDPLLWPQPGYHLSSDNPGDPYLLVLPGRGFWLKLSAPKLVSVDGTAAGPAVGQPFSLPIVSGWQQLGNPFTTAVDFTQAMITVAGGDKTLNEASASGIAENYGWLYNAASRSYQLLHGSIPFARQSLPPYNALWYRAYTSGVLKLVKPVGALSVGPRADAEARRPSAQDWAIPVVATVEGAAASDSATVLGVHPQAAAITHIMSPPNLSEYVDVYFPASDVQAAARYATDFVDSLTGSHIWDFVVDTDIADADVLLSFPDLTELPRGYHAYLVHKDTGTRQSLRTRASYRYGSGAAAGERSFALEVTTDSAAVLTVDGVAAAPTRGPGADISFGLSQSARVQVEILNAAGRRVSVVATDGVLPRGRSAVAWNGRSEQGALAPTGVYVVRVRAVGSDGQQASGITAMTLSR